MIKENINENNFSNKESVNQENVEASRDLSFEKFNNLKKEIRDKIIFGSGEVIKKGSDLLKHVLNIFGPDKMKEGQELIEPVNEEINNLSEETLVKIESISAESETKSEDLLSLKKREEELNLAELRKASEIACSHINWRANRLGVEIETPSSEDIAFSSKDAKYLGTYNTYDDSIKCKNKSIATLIHESLHFVSAIDERSGQKLAGEKRLSKSGFCSVWDTGDNSYVDIFRALNEAVTEKMAQEIYSFRKDKIENDLSMPLVCIFWERKDVIKQQKEIELNSLNQEGKKSSVEDIRSINDKYKNKLERNFLDEQKEYLEDDFAYVQEISILDAILEKTSKYNSEKNGIPIQLAKMYEWDDLQRAYLKGNTLYLKKIAQVVGLDILKEFSSLDRNKTEEEFELQVQTILSHIRKL